MTSILLIGPDPQTREILKLRFEVDGYDVATAIGKSDVLELMSRMRPDLALIDMIDYEDEWKEVISIAKVLKKAKSISVLLLPRGIVLDEKTSKRREACKDALKVRSVKTPLADLIVTKPYDLNVLTQQVYNLISTPKKSSTSRRGLHQQS